MNFYIENFFHVQALNFKMSDSDEFLFKGKGEISGGACFLGISAYITGESLSILADSSKDKALALIFEIGAIDVNTNKDTKGFCALKFDSNTKKWCAIGVDVKIEDAKKLIESNPNCY